MPQTDTSVHVSLLLYLDAMKMDRALLDISPDDAVDLNNKKRILRWDAKKRKFVKVRSFSLFP